MNPDRTKLVERLKEGMAADDMWHAAQTPNVDAIDGLFALAADELVRVDGEWDWFAEGYALFKARATAAEQQLAELRLTICGGEDAPGYNASLSHAEIMAVLKEHYAAWRDATDRATAAEAERDEWRKAHANSEVARVAQMLDLRTAWEAAEAHNEAMRLALEPFAEGARSFDGFADDELVTCDLTIETELGSTGGMFDTPVSSFRLAALSLDREETDLVKLALWQARGGWRGACGAQEVSETGIDHRGEQRAHAGAPFTHSQPIWIVHGSTGEWSDRSEWVVCAFSTECEAKSYVESLTLKRQELGPEDSSDYRACDATEKAMREFDPNYSEDYTGTRWFISETRLMAAREGTRVAFSAERESSRDEPS